MKKIINITDHELIARAFCTFVVNGSQHVVDLFKDLDDQSTIDIEEIED
jgi:hypothetical protein